MIRNMTMLLAAALLAATGAVSALGAEQRTQVASATDLSSPHFSLHFSPGAHFSTMLFAQAEGGGWPAVKFSRGSGGGVGYLAIWKVLLIWIMFLLWLYTTTWINRDSQVIG